MDWINSPDRLLQGYRGSDRSFLWLIAHHFRFLARRRHELNPRKGRVSVRQLPDRAGFVVVQADADGGVVGRWEYPVRPIRTRAQRPTLRKSVEADARELARVLRRSDGAQETTGLLSRPLRLGSPTPAPTRRAVHLYGRLSDEWDRQAQRPVRLLRCRSPRCAIAGGAYFFPRSSERDCTACREVLDRFARNRDVAGVTKSLEVAWSGRQVLSQKTRCKRP